MDILQTMKRTHRTSRPGECGCRSESPRVSLSTTPPRPAPSFRDGQQPRFDLPGIPQHIAQRGNNLLPCCPASSTTPTAPLSAPARRSAARYHVRAARLCAHGQPRAPAGEAECSRRHLQDDAKAPTRLSQPVQCKAPPHGSLVGRTIQSLPGRHGNPGPALLPPHRPQSGPSAHDR
jgi:hypothetical protein